VSPAEVIPVNVRVCERGDPGEYPPLTAEEDSETEDDVNEWEGKDGRFCSVRFSSNSIAYCWSRSEGMSSMENTGYSWSLSTGIREKGRDLRKGKYAKTRCSNVGENEDARDADGKVRRWGLLDNGKQRRRIKAIPVNCPRRTRYFPTVTLFNVDLLSLSALDKGSPVANTK